LENNGKKPIAFTDTTFRDGQQSLIATRMSFEEMEPALELMDDVGFHSMEVWGGATFDACLRYLNEDPWERLRAFKKRVRKTKLQMLFRGQNMLGYKAYPDDVVDKFLELAIKNGIDIVRIFDALNDSRNLESSVKAVKKYGGHAQMALSYTTSEVHTVKYYVDLAKEFEQMGADSIAVKDMAGLLMPAAARELVSELKKATSLPIQVHSHYTSGLAGCAYLEAARAGADILDAALSPFAMGSSQPAAEVMAAILGDYRAVGLDAEAMSKASALLAPVRERALKSGLLDAVALSVNIDMLKYQVPGGMLSNLVAQLKQSGAEDRYEEVLREIPRVRADFGFPPLVTPSSQIVGTQAVMNVISGERYKMAPKESKELVKGMYGKTPVPVSDEVARKVIGDEPRVTAAPAELLKPGLAAAREELLKEGDLLEGEEDVLSYALFPQIAAAFFKKRQAAKYGADPELYNKERNTYPI
jgi:oxaloacetate decarboxylase alpha subunit